MRRYDGRAVEIMAMAECPNNCEHCFIKYNGHINFNTLEQMIQQYHKEYDEVILNGTELLMNDKYLELCKKNNQDFIYTNGNLLTYEKRQVLKKYGINRISVSLHYGIQNQISKSTIKEISKVIIDAVNDGFSVRVLCTISKNNYKLIPVIADYVKGLGASSIKFINMMKEGKAERLEDVFLQHRELIEFFNILDLTRKKYNPSEFYVTRNGGFGNDIMRENNFCCEAGRNIVVITPEHKVYPCNFLLYDEFCIGYWNDTGIYIEKEFHHNSKECTALQRQLVRKKYTDL